MNFNLLTFNIALTVILWRAVACDEHHHLDEETQKSNQAEPAPKIINKKSISFEDDDDSDELLQPTSLNLFKLKDTEVPQQVDLEAILEFLQGLVDERRLDNVNSKRQAYGRPHFVSTQQHLRLPKLDSSHDILCFHRQYGVKLNKMLLAKNCTPKRIKFQIQNAKSPGKLTSVNTVQVDSGPFLPHLVAASSSTSAASLPLFKEMAKALRAKTMKKKFDKFALL